MKNKILQNVSIKKWKQEKILSFFSGKLLPCDASDQRLLTMTSDNEAIF